VVGLSFVRSEEVPEDVIRGLCEELKPRRLFSSEAIEFLDEYILEICLRELCEECNIMIDSRTTLRRYSAVFDPELRRWICSSGAPPRGGLCMLDLSGYLYEALSRDEA